MPDRHNGPKSIWLALETLRPLRWAIRYGNQWWIVKTVKVLIPLRTRRGTIQPKAYLVGRGRVQISHKYGGCYGDHAVLT